MSLVSLGYYINDVKFIRLNEYAVTPTRGTPYSAGYDLHAAIPAPIIIEPGSCCLIGTGLAIALSAGTFGAIYPRSGLAVKRGLRLANDVAVIDQDYRGEWKVPLFNDSKVPQLIEPGERIAQVVVTPYISVTFEEVDELDETDRGEGGFGSTGTK